jgi:hypothetical protein
MNFENRFIKAIFDAVFEDHRLLELDYLFLSSSVLMLPTLYKNS